MRTVLSICVIAVALLVPVIVEAQEIVDGASDSGPAAFPLREPDSSSPMHVVWELLKLGIDGGEEEKAFRSYLNWVAKDRIDTKAKQGELKEKEFKNLLRNASGYFTQDQYGLKLMVISMTPKPDKIEKSTKKVYIALRNVLEPDDRSGLFILERGPKGWVVRSLNL